MAMKDCAGCPGWTGVEHSDALLAGPSFAVPIFLQESDHIIHHCLLWAAAACSGSSALSHEPALRHHA